MDTLQNGTPWFILIGIIVLWTIGSLALGAKKAYFEPWDNIPEEEKSSPPAQKESEPDAAAAQK